LTQHFILIVDDDEDIRETLREILEDEGYLVRVAANGADALATLAESQKPCLILLDLMMPVMDGYRFRTEQVKHADLASIPVIVITAGGAVRTKELAVTMIMPKPLSVQQLVAAVGQHC
jgi:CheY-like chemotaxis protein